jgi:hypothetical protein
MTHRVSGFLLLRKPNYNSDVRGAVESPPWTPQVDGIFYGGLERMPWFDLQQAFHDGALSNEALLLREDLMRSNATDRDVMVLQDVRKAETLLAALENGRDRLETCAVYSERLSRIKGCVQTDLEIEWLGVDLYCGGYGSMIHQGLFKRPELFSDFVLDVVPHGLFEDSSAAIEKYIEHYVRLERRENLELFEPVLEYLDRIRVGRVLGPSHAARAT